MTIPAWPAAKRRRRGRLVAGIVTGVVVLAAGAFATFRLLDDAGGTGADSPEAAAQALLTAVTNGDALGVLDLLPDGERAALVDAVPDLADAGARHDVLADGFGLDAVPGVAVAVPDPVLDVRTLADGIAAVDVGRDASLELDLGALLGPLGLDDRLGTSGRAPAIGVVEEDDGWHPSIAATAALLFEPGDPVEPAGSGAPLGAVADLLDAVADGDRRAALAVFDPEEAGPWQALGTGSGSLGDLSVVVTDSDVEDLGDGVHRVVPTGVRVEVDDLRLTLADGCVTVARAEQETERCRDDLPPELDGLASSRAGFVTVERDGEHFVSPLRTALDLARAGVEGLAPGDLDEVVRDFVDDVEADLEPDERPGPNDDLDEVPNDDDVPLRTPTGASGPGGALVAGDVVEGDLAAGATATFTVVAGGGEGYIGAQATGDADLTIRVVDAESGEELDANDDFVGQDPEAFVRTVEGQRLTVEVAGFDEDQAGGFVVYYEQ